MNKNCLVISAACFFAFFSALIPVSKQGYVLYKELSDKDFYAQKSMNTDIESLDRLTDWISSSTSYDVVICSRRDYDASLFLTIRLWRINRVQSKNYIFPHFSRCRDYSLLNKQGQLVVFYGAGQSPALYQDGIRIHY